MLGYCFEASSQTHTGLLKVPERIRNEVYFEGTQHVLVYVIYSSTDVVNDSDKKAFFKDLHESLFKEEPHSVDVVLGDFNGRTGLDKHQQNSQIIGRYTYRDSTNNEGQRLVDLFSQTTVYILSLVFPQRLHFKSNLRQTPLFF